jgi:hypothetical protein
MTHTEERFDAISRFPTVFVESIPDTLPLRRQVNTRIRLKDSNLTINMTQYKIGHNLLLKLKEWIDKQMRGGILHRSKTSDAASMFVQPKFVGRI